MRVAHVVHGLPPHSRGGVQVHALALARALARRGHDIHLFAPRREAGRMHLEQRREELEGCAVTWLFLNAGHDDEQARHDPPGAREGFARFLERERPALVLFEHVFGLGLGLLEEARSREVPSVYIAHDPYPLSRDPLLLRVDLRPLPPADEEALARNVLARAWLDARWPEGDHHGLVLPETLAPADREHLERLLDPLQPLDGPEDPAHSALLSARDLVRTDRSRRRAAFDTLEAIVTPTRWMADLLRAHEVSAPTRVFPCGIEREPLAEVPPIDPSRRPLRLGLFGTLAKHKGAHVLIEALRRLPSSGSVTLEVHGGSTDAAYRAHLEGLAEGLAVRFHGPYEQAELPRLLAQVELVCVPSIWPEHAPFVIREAFAARRPVLASEIGALAESLEAGGGELVRAGDPDAWAEAIERLALDPQRLAALAEDIPVVRSIDEEAADLEGLFEEAVRYAALRRAARRARLPASVRPFARASDALDGWPTPRLVAGALVGLERLRGRLARGRSDLGRARELARLLGAAEGLRERFADRAREARWREEVLGEERRRAEWLEKVAAARDAEREAASAERDAERRAREHLEAELRWRSEAQEAARREIEWLSERVAAAEREAAWRRELQADREARLAEARRALEDLRAARDALAAERDQLVEIRRHREAEARELRARTEELEHELAGVRAGAGELRSQLAWLQRDHDALARHERWLRAELAACLAPLTAGAGVPGPDEAGALLARARRRLAALEEELALRRREMGAARAEAGRGLARWLGGRLARRARRWSDAAGVEAPPTGAERAAAPPGADRDWIPRPPRSDAAPGSSGPRAGARRGPDALGREAQA